MCAKCKKGGELVECDTCSQSMHPGCDKQMPTNVWEKNAAYQCPCCQRENVSEQTYTSESEEEIRQPQKTQKHKSTYVETDSEDDNHNEHAKSSNNTTNNKTRTDTPKMVESRDERKNKGETTTCTNTTTNDPHQQNTSIGFNVESDSDDEDTGKKHPTQTTRKADTPSTRTTKKQRLGKRNKRDITIQPTLQTNEHANVTVETECKRGKHTGNTIAPNTISESKTQQHQTQREELNEQNALQIEQTRPKVEVYSDKKDTNDVARKMTTINKEVTRKRKLRKNTHNTHDKDRQGRPTLGIHIQDERLQNHITTYLKATVLYALGDGHCLRRSLGKIENISPGEVVRKMKTYCENVLNTQTTLYIDEHAWYHRLANPPDHWLKLETSVPSHTSIFAGISELHIWAIITQKPVITLNAITGTATVFTPDQKALPKVYTNPQQAHEETRERHTTPPGYVLYNNINHYNAIITQAQREEHAKQQPSKQQKTSPQSETTTTNEKRHSTSEDIPIEKKKRTLSSFFDTTVQPKKQRKNKSMTKDGTGAGTSNNDTLMPQKSVQAQTKATTTQAEITAVATTITTETGLEIKRRRSYNPSRTQNPSGCSHKN